MAGTTTILFTDIEDSTNTIYRLGDRTASDTIRAHFELLEAVIEGRGGTLTKTLGDGVMALFDAAYDGVLAAIAMQQAASRSARGGQADLGLRVGLHVGDVIAGSNDDVFGGAIVVARRLCDTAERDQILASELVKLLVGNRPEIAFEPVGAVELKGIPEPVLASTVAWRAVPDPAHIRVVVAEDAAIIRAGIVRLLIQEGFDVVAEANDYDSLIAAVESKAPDLIVTDIRMPPTQTDEGLQAAAYVKERHPHVGVLVLSQHITTSAAARLLDGQTAGIGYLLKERVSELDEFVDSARRVASGATIIDPIVTEQLLHNDHRDAVRTLSGREREVLELMAQGRSNQAISTALFLSPKTVESHVRSIFLKLDLPECADGNRRVQAVVQWLEGQVDH